MTQRSFQAYWALGLFVWTAGHTEEPPHLASPEVTGTRPFLRYERPPYQNYAINHFTNYPEHTWRHGNLALGLSGPKGHGDGIGVDRPQAMWSPLGEYLMTGYDLFSWVERRQPEQREGSEAFNDGAAWDVFNQVALGRDGYGEWGYSAITGDGLIARFTPLTLSKTDFDGLRLDLSLPHVKFTGLGSRMGVFSRTDMTMLLGARAQVDLGVLSLGLSGVNLHRYDPTQPGNSMKGRLPPRQPLFEWLIVRVADDAPTDGRGGAVVQEVRLILNGQLQPDIRPRVIRHQARTQSQVGVHLRSTGAFLRASYNHVEGSSQYYRGREKPLFADYFYRLAHEAGAEVSKDTYLEGLLANFALEASEGTKHADDAEQLVYLFDLSSVRYAESVEVEAVLGNDYRVEWAGIYVNEPLAQDRRFDRRFRSTVYRTALRARGSVQDGSNLKRVRFNVGENTGIFTYSVDMHLALPSVEISSEYARSAVYARYPTHLEGRKLFDAGPRFANRGSAYFINALHRFGRGRVGAEYFTMNPDFTTEMLTSAPPWLDNQTIIWHLVQDNEDGDRWPEVRLWDVSGSPRTTYPGAYPSDGDGTFPGQDEDRDGLVDTDRNLNAIPDYEETFLLYEVEPNEYVYGLDRNHNDEPDAREDDWDADYPYDPNQQGYHLFGQMDLSPHASLELGRYAIKELVSCGRNRSFYVELPPGGGRAAATALFREQLPQGAGRHCR